jgi:anti-sigma-K factor RskA
MIIPWATSDQAGYTSVTGDVVWNNSQQAGFMRLAGMPSNKVSELQYQLWIVDPTRDSKPVDGGVFDIPAGADEVIVPIDAKLAIVTPQAFAITAEQPGGVVVSAGPLLVVAPVSG